MEMHVNVEKLIMRVNLNYSSFNVILKFSLYTVHFLEV